MKDFNEMWLAKFEKFQKESADKFEALIAENKKAKHLIRYS